MHFFKTERKSFATYQLGNSSKNINIDNSGDDDYEKDYKEKYPRMGHIIITCRRLPMSLPDHYTHYQEEGALTNVAEQGEG